MDALPIIWFVLIAVLFAGYAMLDGFDLGVGFWHLFAKRDAERQTLMRAIGPVWDGNEVWLVTAGGALFAAFPAVYASVFSGMYLAMMLVLFALIFRAVSLEFRHQEPWGWWRSLWDGGFAAGSALAALLFGVALGNILNGVELDAQGNFMGGFFSLLNPYSLGIGLTTLAMMALHGALWVQVKTDGPLAAQAARWARASWFVYVALFLVASVWTIVGQPHLMANARQCVALFALPVLSLGAAGAAFWFNGRGRPGAAFLASLAMIATNMATVAAGLFPALVSASNDPALSLTIFNASSGETTLTVMLIVAAVGMPVVLAYQGFVYHLFRGKVSVKDGGTHGY